MVLIARTDQGRIFVRHFEIEKSVYLFLQEFYPNLKCYAVELNDNNLNIFIHHHEDIQADFLVNIQNEAKKYFQEKMGIYFKSINFIVK